MKRIWKKYAPELSFMGLSLLVGLIGGLITYRGMPAYELVNKPWFTPPDALFPVVWTVLYLLMGYGMGRVWKAPSTCLMGALWAFAAQLVLNLFWTVWFFLLQQYLVAFVWLLGLLAAVGVMIWLFACADRKAALLQIPYFLWLCFAAVLNLYVYLLN